jgi:hypothetical protein
LVIPSMVRSGGAAINVSALVVIRDLQRPPSGSMS